MWFRYKSPFLRESAIKCYSLEVLNTCAIFRYRWKVLEMNMEQQGLTEEEVCMSFLCNYCGVFWSILLPTFA